MAKARKKSSSGDKLPQKATVSDNSEKFMTLGEHLDELRNRIIQGIVILTALMVISLFFGAEIHKIFSSPYKRILGEQATFYQIKLMAPFIIYLKTSFMIAVLFGFPLIFFLIWGFISPAFDSNFQKYGKFIIAFSTLLFWGGVALCWFSVFENLLRVFLVDFRPADIDTQLPIDEYYDIFFNIHLVFGLTFQLPVIMIILGRMGILRSSSLLKYWREMTLAMSVAAAFLSPGPDVISMMMLFVPLMVLFFLSVFIMKFFERKK